MDLKKRQKLKQIDRDAEDFLFDLYVKIDEYVDQHNLSLNQFYKSIESDQRRHYELKLGRVNPNIRKLIKLTHAIGKNIIIT